MRFEIGPPKRHIIPMRPNTRALAALTRYGSCAPPAPSAFIAFQSPGAKKPTAPMTKALKRVVRYQVRRAGPLTSSVSVTGSGFADIVNSTVERLVCKFKLKIRQLSTNSFFNGYARSFIYSYKDLLISSLFST